MFTITLIIHFIFRLFKVVIINIIGTRRDVFFFFFYRDKIKNLIYVSIRQKGAARTHDQGPTGKLPICHRRVRTPTLSCRLLENRVDGSTADGASPSSATRLSMF